MKHENTRNTSNISRALSEKNTMKNMKERISQLDNDLKLIEANSNSCLLNRILYEMYLCIK